MAFIEIITEDEKLVKECRGSRIYFRRLDAETALKIQRAGGEEERIGQLVDYIITDWENVLHPVTKRPVPCTKENKLRLPQGLLADILAQANEAEAGRAEEEQLKNYAST